MLDGECVKIEKANKHCDYKFICISALMEIFCWQFMKSIKTEIKVTEKLLNVSQNKS